MSREEPRGRHPVARAFFRSPSGLIGSAMVVLLLGLAVLGPVIWGAEAKRTDLLATYEGSSSAHLLGTDSLGRDILARTLSATRLTLELGSPRRRSRSSSASASAPWSPP